MDRKIKGFASYDAVLSAVESRSSSPVRIPRDGEMFSNITDNERFVLSHI